MFNLRYAALDAMQNRSKPDSFFDATEVRGLPDTPSKSDIWLVTKHEVKIAGCVHFCLFKDQDEVKFHKQRLISSYLDQTSFVNKRFIENECYFLMGHISRQDGTTCILPARVANLKFSDPLQQCLEILCCT